MTTDEEFQAALQCEAQQRLWVKTLAPLLELRRGDDNCSDPVRFARELVQIAAAQRLCRILRTDLGDEARASETQASETALAAEGR